jgi:hypothetical protein
MEIRRKADGSKKRNRTAEVRSSILLGSTNEINKLNGLP